MTNPKINTRYLNHFLKCKCAPDMIKRGLFPNIKEITESFAAYEAVKKLQVRFDDPYICVFCIGDGHTPRTAATFSFRSAWQCVSIDPNLRNKSWNIERLICINKKIEDIDFLSRDSLKLFCNTYVIVMVHSHATIKDTLEKIKHKNRHLIHIPCCVDAYANYIKTSTYLSARVPNFVYKDDGIWSEKNLVRIWRNI